MKQLVLRKLRIILTAIVLLLLTLPVLAQSGGEYDLSWSTVDGGGGSSTGSVYSLSGTAGQMDAGMMSGKGFTLKGGFWLGGELEPYLYELFLPLIVK